MLGAVLIEAENGSVLTMLVGGDETVLDFDDYDPVDWVYREGRASPTNSLIPFSNTVAPAASYRFAEERRCTVRV